MSLLTQLEQWQQAGALRALDLALVRFIHNLLPQADEAVLLAVALVSERSGHSHVCLDLQQALTEPGTLLSLGDELMNERASGDAANDPILAQVAAELQTRLRALTLEEWTERLRACEAVSSGDEVQIAASTTPFVLAGSSERPLFYLRRYWQCERLIRQGIASRLLLPTALDAEAVRPLLDTLFGADAAPAGDPNWQKVACALAARSGFAIITGGPGTGKTTTVLRLLALLQGIRLEQGRSPLTIRLAAPTGKAAARLNDSIAGSLQRLALPDTPQVSAETLRAAIPTEVTTLHRLLGPRPDSRKFRHQAGNPLGADLVVVDEASMVDVELMAALLDALRPEARLILLGDKDQLASVEAGYVLGDLCAGAGAGHYWADTARWLQTVSGEQIPDRFLDPLGTPLQQALTMLRHSHRFQQGGVIHSLATLVNEGQYQGQAVDERLPVLKAIFAAAELAAAGRGEAPVLRLLHQPQRSVGGAGQGFMAAVERLIIEGYRGYLEPAAQVPAADRPQADFDAWGLGVLKAHARFQLLAALRRGDWGVEGLNRRIEQGLAGAGLLSGSAHQWYPGRPVLVTRNDYGLGLMNGDIGICLPCRGPCAGDPLALRVLFPDGKGGVRWVLPSRLQAVETVFAMTVHKSQGSEFEHTVLLLPDHATPVLTRELIYTGITRASLRFTLIYGDEAALEQGMQRRVERASGLLAV